MNSVFSCLRTLTTLLLASGIVAAAQPSAPRQSPASAPEYLLGPGDEISILVLGLEPPNQTVRIEPAGSVNLLLVGRIHVAEKTVEQVERELKTRFGEFMEAPQVVVNVVAFRSRPVSVIGAVKNPGVHQLQGNMTVIEVLSLAQGLQDDAGHSVRITRLKANGPIPLPTAAPDGTGQYSVAQISLKSLLDASNPQENIRVLPNDVISVPLAEMVYVIGDVVKAGGFVLRERESMSVLQALSMAGGLGPMAAPQTARILRLRPNSPERKELAVDVRVILQGKAPDVALLADDILFIPNNTGKAVALRTIEAAVQIGTGIVIWRR